MKCMKVEAPPQFKRDMYAPMMKAILSEAINNFTYLRLRSM